MAKPIKGSEIIEDGHLKNAITQAETLKKVYSELDTQIKKTASTAKSGLGGVNPNSAKGIQQINAEVQKSINLKKQSKTVTDQLRKAEDLEVQGRLKLAEANRKQRAELKLKIQLENSEAGSLNRLSLNVKKYEQELRKLNLTTKDGRLRQQELIAKINQSNAVFKKNSSALSQSRINVGRYSSALKGAKASLTSFAGALGLTSGVFLLAQGLRESVELIVNFDKSTANLASILGTTKDGINALTEDAKRLGQATANTASEIVGLQTELAKLGFTRKEILDSTEAIQQLAQATGTDLAQSAVQVGSALRIFGLEATESQRVVDVLASSTTKSALDMSKLATALPIVGTTAKTAGLSIERTTALLGVLSDRGIDASTSGTSLRKIFLDLAKNGMTWDEAMKQINDSQDKLTTANNLFGVRGATTAVILAENGASADSLTKSLEMSGGTAQAMADTQLDSLSGSLTLLKSAYEGFILSLESGDGALAQFARTSIDALTSILQLLAGVEATDEVLENSAIGRVILDFNRFTESLDNAFSSLDNYKESVNSLSILIIDFANVLGNLVTGGTFSDIDKAVFGLAESTEKYEEAQREAIRITALAQTGIKKYGEAVTEYTIKEQRKIDLLASGNLTQEDRNDLITEITDKYPDLIEGYDLENLTQEQAIKLNKELQKELINTAILKQKSLALTFLNVKVEEELANAEKITNATVKAQRIKDIKDTEKVQLARIDAIEEETRVRLGLKKVIDDTIEGGSDSDTGSGGSGGSGGGNNPTVEIDLIPVVDGLPLEDYKFSEHTNQISEQIIDDVDNIGEEIESTVGKDSLNVFTRFYHEWQLMSEENKEKLIDDVKELADQTTELFKGVAESINMELDASIEQSQNRITDSEERISDLKQQAQLGNLDAQESVKAEKQAIANERENIEALEKKKRNLQILVTGLNLANQKIQSGDGNALASASGEMGGFISTLKGFYKGTETTLGADLGNAYAISGDKDTHIIKAHKDEHIIGVDNSRKLGKMKQSDIVKGALMLKNGEFVGRRAINAVNQVDVLNDARLVNVMGEVKQAINNIQIPEHKFNYDALSKIATETIRIGNKTTNNHKPMF